MKREKVNTNYMWKYVKPLKYFFLKYKINASRIKEKELQLKSKKWQIVDIDANKSNDPKTNKYIKISS